VLNVTFVKNVSGDLLWRDWSGLEAGSVVNPSSLSSSCSDMIMGLGSSFLLDALVGEGCGLPENRIM